MAKSKESITSTGLGESRIFVAPPDDPMREELPIRTVNGVPIPPELAHAIPYENTDQGIEERAMQPTARTTVVADAFDKRISERRGALMDGIPTWAAPDPMKTLADKHVAPGMRPKFLSPSKCDREGTRGWKPVADENGNLVKLGNMILGEMPEEAVARRKAALNEAARQAQAEVIGEFEEQSAQILSAAKRSSAPRHDPDGDSGLHSETGNSHF